MPYWLIFLCSKVALTRKRVHYGKTSLYLSESSTTLILTVIVTVGSGVDYIEEEDGQISTFEFKWNPGAKYKYPQQFIEAYPNSSFKVINRSNIEEFLLDL